MAQIKDLNVSPYYDDFDEKDNFHKVLFRPGFSIQARELTTLQSILQGQIEQHGKHMFKEGTVVIPGQASLSDYYTNIQLETTFGGEDIVADDARAPSFILHQNGNGSVSLDELLDGKEAVIIGITLPASSNAIDQTIQMEKAVERLDGRVSAVQIVTGENVRMDDLDTIAQITNASWPILIDDGESRFAKRMPMGVSDSIVIIDSSGPVSYTHLTLPTKA